jgi:hypothetical protein
MTTDLVLDTLEHAIWTRRQAGITDLSGLIQHTDAGSQYFSVAFTQRLTDEGVDPSVGSVGDSLLTGYSAGEPVPRHAVTCVVRCDSGARVQHESHDGQGGPAARAA